MTPIQALTPHQLTRAFPEITLVESRRVVGALHRVGRVPDSIRGVRRSSLAILQSLGKMPALEVRDIFRSPRDAFVKYSLALPDGQIVEAVRIPLERVGRFSVCVSSQAGCGLRCSFCATGRMGLARNLQTWEIVDQVRLIRRVLRDSGQGRVHGVVFQGMGEPLANIDAVIESIRLFCEPSALAISARAITVSTVGLPEGILRLAREVPKVRLGISIGSVRPEVRRKIMPIEDSFPLTEVIAAGVSHATLSGLAPMWAVTLLAGVNDSLEDASALAEAAREFRSRAGLTPRISVIAYNPIADGEEDPYRRTGAREEEAFRSVLHRAGIATHRRYSGGSDVRAACGQLAAVRIAG